MDREKLYRDLYLAARSCVTPGFENNPEAVRALRDYTCDEMYNNTYENLSDTQLINVIQKLRTGKKTDYPTKRQLELFRFYSFAVALVYCNFDNFEYFDKETGEIFKENELRKYLTDLFFTKKRLPDSCVRRIYSEFINKKSNEFLKEGKYKATVTNENVMYYERLRNKEIQYLITRYCIIFQEKYGKTTVPININNN